MTITRAVQLPAEEEAFRIDRIPAVRTLHVFIHLGDGHVKVEAKAQNSAGEQHNKHAERRIFKVGDLFQKVKSVNACASRCLV